MYVFHYIFITRLKRIKAHTALKEEEMEKLWLHK